METEPKKKGRGRPPKAKDGDSVPKKKNAGKRGRPKTDGSKYSDLKSGKYP